MGHLASGCPNSRGTFNLEVRPLPKPKPARLLRAKGQEEKGGASGGNDPNEQLSTLEREGDTELKEEELNGVDGISWSGPETGTGGCG